MSVIIMPETFVFQARMTNCSL